MQYRKCATDTLLGVTSGECKEFYDSYKACRDSKEYDYGRKCKEARQLLQKCAAKNKIGEFGNKYV